MNANGNNFKFKEEYIFIILSLLFGVLFSFLNPPFQNQIENRSFIISYALTDGAEIISSKSDNSGIMIPRSIIGVQDGLGKIYSDGDGKIEQQRIDDYAELKLHKNDKVFYPLENGSLTLIPILPNFAGMLITDSFNNNPVYLLWASRIGGVIFYSLIIFFAVRLLPFYKEVMLIMALFPGLVIRGSYLNPDLFSIALSFLLTAVFLKYAFTNVKMKIIHLLFVIVIAFIHRYVKGAYFLIPFLALLIPNDKFESKSYKPILLVSLLIIAVLPYFTQGTILNSGIIGTNDNFGIFSIDSDKAFDVSMSAPFTTLYYIIMNLMSQGGQYLSDIVISYGDTAGTFDYIITLISFFVLLVFAVFSKHINGSEHPSSSYFPVLIGVLTVFLIAGFYLIYASPVGAFRIEGMSGICLIPAMFLMLTCLKNQNFQNELMDKFSGLAAGIFSLILLIISVFVYNGQFYI
ncbi:MAG: DUF2142 domain-containing protein [Candidatus Kapaibacterium sp.]